MAYLQHNASTGTGLYAVVRARPHTRAAMAAGRRRLRAQPGSGALASSPRAAGSASGKTRAAEVTFASEMKAQVRALATGRERGRSSSRAAIRHCRTAGASDRNAILQVLRAGRRAGAAGRREGSPRARLLAPQPHAHMRCRCCQDRAERALRAKERELAAVLEERESAHSDSARLWAQIESLRSQLDSERRARAVRGCLCGIASGALKARAGLGSQRGGAGA